MAPVPLGGGEEVVKAGADAARVLMVVVGNVYRFYGLGHFSIVHLIDGSPVCLKRAKLIPAKDQDPSERPCN
jgi:hypothetical protein